MVKGRTARPRIGAPMVVLGVRVLGSTRDRANDLAADLNISLSMYIEQLIAADAVDEFGRPAWADEEHAPALFDAEKERPQSAIVQLTVHTPEAVRDKGRRAAIATWPLQFGKPQIGRYLESLILRDWNTHHAGGEKPARPVEGQHALPLGAITGRRPA